MLCFALLFLPLCNVNLDHLPLTPQKASKPTYHHPPVAISDRPPSKHWQNTMGGKVFAADRKARFHQANASISHQSQIPPNRVNAGTPPTVHHTAATNCPTKPDIRLSEYQDFNIVVVGQTDMHLFESWECSTPQKPSFCNSISSRACFDRPADSVTRRQRR